ncbi:MAG: hypothetical protein OEL53_18745 [Rhodospirillales bacterium]|nr:hypothetical protein [Rhodospirillales bacterium]
MSSLLQNIRPLFENAGAVRKWIVAATLLITVTFINPVSARELHPIKVSGGFPVVLDQDGTVWMQRVESIFHQGWFKIGDLHDIVDIKAGDSLSAALSRDGTVHYWKYAFRFVKGMPDIPEFLPPPIIRTLKGSYTALGAAGSSTIFAMDKAGDITIMGWLGWGGWEGPPVKFTPSLRVIKVAGSASKMSEMVVTKTGTATVAEEVKFVKLPHAIHKFFLLYEDGTVDSCELISGRVECGKPLPLIPRPVVNIHVNSNLAVLLDDDSVMLIDPGRQAAVRWQGHNVGRICVGSSAWVQKGASEMVSINPNLPSQDVRVYRFNVSQWITEIIDLSCDNQAIVLGKNDILIWLDTTREGGNWIDLNTDETSRK